MVKMTAKLVVSSNYHNDPYVLDKLVEDIDIDNPLFYPKEVCYALLEDVATNPSVVEKYKETFGTETSYNIDKIVQRIQSFYESAEGNYNAFDLRAGDVKYDSGNGEYSMYYEMYANKATPNAAKQGQYVSFYITIKPQESNSIADYLETDVSDIPIYTDD